MTIKIVEELPQWIISSDRAAYHPHTKTIWIKRESWWQMSRSFLHELQHWFIHKFLNNNEKYHNYIDGK